VPITKRASPTKKGLTLGPTLSSETWSGFPNIEFIIDGTTVNKCGLAPGRLGAGWTPIWWGGQ